MPPLPKVAAAPKEVSHEGLRWRRPQFLLSVPDLHGCHDALREWRAVRGVRLRDVFRRMDYLHVDHGPRRSDDIVGIFSRVSPRSG